MKKLLFLFLVIVPTFVFAGDIVPVDQWIASTSPYTAISPRTNGKNIYAPYSNATTSSLYANTLCLIGDTCRTTWPTGGGSGTVTSIDASGGTTGFSFTGGPVTTSGTLTLSGTLGLTNGGTNNTSFASSTLAISDGTRLYGIATSSLGISGSGTVTSVDATVPTGLSVSGVPFTTSGTIALGLTAGYIIPLSASTTNWNTFYDTPSNRITAGTNLSWSGNTLNASAGVFAWTPQSWGNATSTTLGFLNGFFSIASSTISAPLHLSSLSDGGLSVFSGLVSSGATTTAGTGLTYTGNAFNVNTSQNIATLSNLTGNGFVKTSGGTGLLSIDTTTYLSAALTSLNGLTGATQTFATTSSAGGWGFTSSGTTHTLNIPTASATNELGLLSNTDWSTFNNKQPAGSYLTSAITGLSDIFHTALTGATQTLSTSTADTNLGMTIVSSGSTHLFTPYWIGTLADNRISSAATWNAKADALSGTINEIAYFNSASTIASLAVATYPSLTELSYGKGVTSAIQTQINAKAPLASPIFTGTVTTPTIKVENNNGLYLKDAGGSFYQQFLNADTGTTQTNTLSLKLNNASRALTLGGDLTISNNLTFTGTNGTTMTFPSTNATIARTDTGQTFTGLNQFANASSTQFSAATQSFYIDSNGRVQAKDTTNAWSGVISPTRSFGLTTGTTTTWTASTTGSAYSPFIVMPFAGTLKQVRCATDTSFLGVNTTVNASNATPSYFVASTTVGTVKYSAGNTFTAGQKIAINVGTTTTATATSISCTLDVTETY